MNTKGFTLFELIVTILLIGIVGVLSSLFLYNGVKGFLTSKLASEGSLTAQIAIDRIGLELRNIEKIDSFDNSGDIIMDYTSYSLPGARRLRYDSANQRIVIGVDGQEYVLLDRVLPSRDLDFCVNIVCIVPMNLDNTTEAKEEIAGFDVAFSIDGIDRSFSTRVYPRTLLTDPRT